MDDMNTRGKNERGASAVEYGLFAAGVAAAIIMPLQALGVGLDTFFEKCAEPAIATGMLDESAGEACS